MCWKISVEVLSNLRNLCIVEIHITKTISSCIFHTIKPIKDLFKHILHVIRKLVLSIWCHFES